MRFIAAPASVTPALRTITVCAVCKGEFTPESFEAHMKSSVRTQTYMQSTIAKWCARIGQTIEIVYVDRFDTGLPVGSVTRTIVGVDAPEFACVDMRRPLGLRVVFDRPFMMISDEQEGDGDTWVSDEVAYDDIMESKVILQFATGEEKVAAAIAQG